MQSTLFDQEEMSPPPLSGGRTSRAYSATKATPSDAFLALSLGKTVSCNQQGKNGRTLVVCMDPKEQSRGGFLTPNISEWPNDAAAVLFESEGVRRDTPPSRETGQEIAADIAPSLTASGRGTSRCGDTRGQDPVVACPLFVTGLKLDQEITGALTAGFGKLGAPEVDAYTAIPWQPPTMFTKSVSLRGREGGATAELGGDVGGTLRASTGGGDKPHVLTVHGTQDPCVSNNVAFALGRNNGGENALFQGLAVRRLTPVECERLQGFPDNHTQIPWRGKPAEGCPDGPRYKAIGNSMAVPVIEWIGLRIQRACCDK